MWTEVRVGRYGRLWKTWRGLVSHSVFDVRLVRDGLHDFPSERLASSSVVIQPVWRESRYDLAS